MTIMATTILWSFGEFSLSLRERVGVRAVALLLLTHPLSSRKEGSSR